MDVLIAKDSFGRLVCTLCSPNGVGAVTAADPEKAAADLLAALEEARETGYAECFWPAPNGEYRWMFRRTDDRLIVAALWSSGTITGWEHVAHDDTDFEAFAAQVRTGLVHAGMVHGV